MSEKSTDSDLDNYPFVPKGTNTNIYTPTETDTSENESEEKLAPKDNQEASEDEIVLDEEEPMTTDKTKNSGKTQSQSEDPNITTFASVEIDKAQDLLRKWKTPQPVLDLLKDDEITIDVLKHFNEDHMTQYFKERSTFKFMAIVIQAMKLWQMSYSDDQVNLNVGIAKEKMCENKVVNLDYIHSNSRAVEAIVNHFEKNCVLEDREQNLLCKHIINFCFTNDIKLSFGKLEKLSQEIADFYSLDMKIFYHYENRKYSGKLYNRWHNQKNKSNRKSTLNKDSLKKPISEENATDSKSKAADPDKEPIVNVAKDGEHCEQSQDNENSNKGTISDSEIFDKGAASQTSSLNGNSSQNSTSQEIMALTLDDKELAENEILRKWSATSRERCLNIYNVQTVQEIFQKFKFLKEQIAIQLIDIDFKHVNDNIYDLIFKKWPDFEQKMLEKIDFYKVTRATEFLKDYKTNSSSYNAEAKKLVCLMSTYIDLGTRTFSQKHQKTIVRNSIQKNVDHFVNEVTNEKEVEEYSGTFDHPRLLFIGPLRDIQAIYVVLGPYKYKFIKIVKAVDFCCQLYLLFDLDIPIDCHDIWQFILKFFYSVDRTRYECSAKLKGLCSFLDKKN